jgi:hypothetical protein
MSKMKVRIAICCMASILAMSCATAPQPAANAQALHGTWVNKDFVGMTLSYKLVYQEGTAFSFAGAESDTPTMEGRYTVVKAWKDAQGVTWLQIFSTWGYPPYNAEAAAPNKWYTLISINPGGDTMEIEQNQIDFPAAFGAMGNYHRVFYKE